MLFLKLLFTPNRYLHQAYVYADQNQAVLCCEMAIDNRVIAVDLPDSLFAWYIALWQITRLAKNPVV